MEVLLDLCNKSGFILGLEFVIILNRRGRKNSLNVLCIFISLLRDLFIIFEPGDGAVDELVFK